MPTPFGYYNFSSTLGSASTLALAAMGQALPVILGGLDLSAGSVISLVNVLIVSGIHDSAGSEILWTLIGLLAGCAVGAVNGFFIAYLRLQPIVVTLATMFITQGVTLSVMKQPGGSIPQSYSDAFVGDVIPNLLPMPLAILAGAVLLWNLISRTRYGTAIYAVGSDEEAARASGIRVRRVKFISYVLAGAFYAAGGVFLTAQTGSGDPLVGPAHAVADLRRRGARRNDVGRRSRRLHRFGVRRAHPDAHRQRVAGDERVDLLQHGRRRRSADLRRAWELDQPGLSALAQSAIHHRQGAVGQPTGRSRSARAKGRGDSGDRGVASQQRDARKRPTSLVRPQRRDAPIRRAVLYRADIRARGDGLHVPPSDVDLRLYEFAADAGFVPGCARARARGRDPERRPRHVDPLDDHARGNRTDRRHQGLQ